MLFPTVTFAIFFLIVLPLSWALMPHRRAWQAWILLASYVFYAWWDWRFVLLLVASTVVNHVLAVAIYRTKPIRTRKALLASAVTFDLALLGYFKYAGFFVTSAENTLSSLGLADATWIVSVTLPVGISFPTFMALSYVIDTYRGGVPASFMRFAVFQAFFPHLVAGPIVRASELLPQLESPRDPRRVDSGRAFLLILSGLFLKVVIANHLATAIVDDVFAAPEAHSSLEVLVGIYAYAVSLRRLLRLHEHRDRSRAAAGVPVPAELCLAVHSGVAAGLLAPLAHDAVPLASRLPLIPLGGSRKGRLVTYRNLMITMLLGGLWHGAAWTFVVWGGIHGVGLACERFVRDRRVARGLPEPPDTARRRWVGRIFTSHVVCFAWIFFRASSFERAGEVITQLFTAWGRPSPLVTTSVLVAILVGIGGQYIRPTTFARVMQGFQRLPAVAQAASLAVGLMIIDTLGPQGVAPFIYFRF